MINFVALDLETANAYRGSICQIGITEVIGKRIRDAALSIIIHSFTFAP